MPGMLSQQPPQTPSSGPVTQTPPASLPDQMVGNPQGGSAPGSGQPGAGMSEDQKFEKLRDEAIQLVYGDRFPQLIEMFQKNGADGFAQSMGVAVNTAISQLEEKYGATNHELAARIGGDLFMKLLEDVITNGVVPDVTLEQVQQALPAALQMYADNHVDVSKEDVQAVASTATSTMQGDQPTQVDVKSAPGGMMNGTA